MIVLSKLYLKIFMMLFQAESVFSVVLLCRADVDILTYKGKGHGMFDSQFRPKNDPGSHLGRIF